MKIYDISQEIFSCVVFPGDPVPQKETVLQIADGDVCNLSAFRMCSHNGTHVDAPYHFYKAGKCIDEMELTHFIGKAYVAEYQGVMGREDAQAVLEKIQSIDAEAAKRILLKGKTVISLEAAKVFAEAKIMLIGNESQTVGPEEAPKEVHLELLASEIALLEGIRLKEVPEGVYFLNAAPINLGGGDGAPCRAVLIEQM